MMTTKLQRALLTRHFSMLVAAPNDTETTSFSETDGDNDFAGFMPKTQLERALL